MNLFFISLFFFFNTVPISGFSSTLSSQFSPFSSIPFCYLFYSFLCNSTSFFLFSFSNILFLHHSPVFHFLLILHLLTLLFTSDFLLIYFFFFIFLHFPSFFLSITTPNSFITRFYCKSCLTFSLKQTRLNTTISSFN